MYKNLPKYILPLILILSSIAYGSNLKLDRALIESAYNGNLKQVKTLIEKGFDLNIQTGGVFFGGGFSALTIASFNGHTEIVKLLKDARAKE